jgi:hypothetical protein
VAGRLSERCSASRLGLVAAAAGPIDHCRRALERGIPAWSALGVTVASLLLIAALSAALARAFVPEVAWGPLLVAALVVPLGTIIPLRGLGGFGNIEALWMGALHCFGGVPLERGFAVGLGIHVVMLVFAAASGLVGFALGSIGPPKRFDTAAGAATITPE